MKEALKTILFAAIFMSSLIAINSCGRNKPSVDVVNPITEGDTTGQTDPMHVVADSLAKEEEGAE